MSTPHLQRRRSEEIATTAQRILDAWGDTAPALLKREIEQAVDRLPPEHQPSLCSELELERGELLRAILESMRTGPESLPASSRTAQSIIWRRLLSHLSGPRAAAASHLIKRVN